MNRRSFLSGLVACLAPALSPAPEAEQITVLECPTYTTEEIERFRDCLAKAVMIQKERLFAICEDAANDDPLLHDFDRYGRVVIGSLRP